MVGDVLFRFTRSTASSSVNFRFGAVHEKERGSMGAGNMSVDACPRLVASLVGTSLLVIVIFALVRPHSRSSNDR